MLNTMKSQRGFKISKTIVSFIILWRELETNKPAVQFSGQKSRVGSAQPEAQMGRPPWLHQGGGGDVAGGGGGGGGQPGLEGRTEED